MSSNPAALFAQITASDSPQVLGKVDVDRLAARDNAGKSLLHYAAARGRHRVLRALLSLAEFSGHVNTVDERRCTPLHVAAACGEDEVLNIMLIYNADVHVVDDVLATPLHYAALHGCLEAARLLTEAGADPLVADAHGLTAIDIAREHGFAQLEAYLTDVLARAVVAGQTTPCSLTEEDEEEIRRLIEHAGSDTVFDVLRYIRDGYGGFTVAQDMLISDGRLYVEDSRGEEGSDDDKADVMHRNLDDELRFSAVYDLRDLESVCVDANTNFLFQLKFASSMHEHTFLYRERGRLIDCLVNELAKTGVHKIAFKRVPADDNSAATAAAAAATAASAATLPATSEPNSKPYSVVIEDVATAAGDHSAANVVVLRPPGRDAHTNVNVADVDGQSHRPKTPPKAPDEIVLEKVQLASDDLPDVDKIALVRLTEPTLMQKKLRSSSHFRSRLHRRYFCLDWWGKLYWSSDPTLDLSEWRSVQVVDVKADRRRRKIAGLLFVTANEDPDLEVRAESEAVRTRWIKYTRRVLQHVHDASMRPE